MLSLFDKIRFAFKNKAPDAEIVGDVKFQQECVPYFTVKMHGCNILVDILAEDILEKFTNKFSQEDIKNATKVFMKYRSLLRLASIENKFAILYDNKNSSYQLIDLSDNEFLKSFDIDSLRAEDAFRLGVHFERIRHEKDRKLFNLSKSEGGGKLLKLVKPYD